MDTKSGGWADPSSGSQLQRADRKTILPGAAEKWPDWARYFARRRATPIVFHQWFEGIVRISGNNNPIETSLNRTGAAIRLVQQPPQLTTITGDDFSLITQ